MVSNRCMTAYDICTYTAVRAGHTIQQAEACYVGDGNLRCPGCRRRR
jgi:hypothetical protein